MVWIFKILKWTWLISIFPVEVICEKDTKCYDNCNCCKNNRCQLWDGWENVCTAGCIDRHRGARCYELCTHDCVSCNNNIHICTECHDGFYLGPNQDCTSECPFNCRTCSSNTRCTACKDGYHNRGGSTTCPYSLCPDNCECSGDTCVACKNGFFDTTTSCDKNCPPNCMVCSSAEQCSKCENGFYNGYNLDRNAGPLFRNCTLKCRDTCDECQSYDTCSQCNSGKYGNMCHNNCSIGCKDGNCHIESGECACTPHFDGNKCNECVIGKYGTYCNKACPEYCKTGKCSKALGHCTEGCVTDTIIGLTCNICTAGTHGSLCNKTCPANCKGTICERNKGVCTGGCEGNFKGNFCDSCVPGKHGPNCELDCSDKCANFLCDKETGNCLSCLGNFYGDNCNACTAGFYGRNCREVCSPQCLNRTCGTDSGICDYGCTNNYTGDKCCVQNETCIKCSSNTECQQCKSGYFGHLCNESCPVNCLDSCEISTGVCSDCVINYFGPFCKNTCSENCNAPRSSDIRLCASSNGRCLFGCEDDFFGETCNKTCSSLCIDNMCRQVDGVCENGCGGSNNDPVCVLDKETPWSTDPPLGPIIGGVSAALVVIISVIVFIVCFLKRRISGNPSDQQKIDAKRDHAHEEHVYENFRETLLLEDDVERNSTLNDERTEVDVDEVEIGERSGQAVNKAIETYYNIRPNSHRVKVNDIFTHVTTRHVDSFTSEFGNLAKDLDLTKHCTFAMKPENLPLNRYNGIYPYDHSRVTISGEPGFFINACYIDGNNNRKKTYIASLGPTAKTTDKFSTFWRMVWNEKSDIIVMLTNLREASGMKCEKYWPDSENGYEELYGPIKVTCRSVETFAEYTVRTFSVSKGKEQRHIMQLHYTAWPDKGVPQEVTSLVEFRQRVKAVPVTLGGPIIVHCSAGVGRSGTYIALDQLTEEGKREGSVNVFNCVNRMRQQRVNMVQTAEQYKFLYKALVHSLTFGCEALTAEEIQGLPFEADRKMFTDIFETLQQEVDIESERDSDDRQDNRRRHKDKNRRHSDIPANRSRVRLYLARADGHHDYINAVFINSFKIKNLFIAAQSPLPGTVEDFLCMIYQQNSSCVVALEESHKHNNDVGKYLPADNESYKCGDFIVTSSKCETKEQYIKKKVSIQNTKKSEAKTVYHFQYKAWGNSKKTPDSVEDFVSFIKDVEKCIRLQTDDNPHIVVHCLNGYERSGLFCVVYTMLEKLEAERQVSVVNTVRKIRTHRKQSIPCVEQLKYCFQCISAYLELYNTYSNFAT